MKKPTIPELMPILEKYKNETDSLHIILDDPNYEDCHIHFCKGLCIDNGQFFGTLACEYLLIMSKTQRAKIGGRW